MLNADGVKKERITIEGKIVHYLFHNQENSYSIAKVRLYEMDEKSITIVGFFSNDLKDQLYTFTGYYHENPRYGLQFMVEKYEVLIPSDTSNLIRYFSGDLFPGIGKKFAQVMVETLGNDLIALIKENPDILNDVPKMTDKRKESIIQGLNQEGNDITSFLQSNGVGLRNIEKIKQTYGEIALKVINENPYALVFDIQGIGFQTADKLAKNLDFPIDSPYRMEAYLLDQVMSMCMSSGDTFVINTKLYYKVRNELSYEAFEEIIDNLVARNLVYVDAEKIYHNSQYKAEIFTSRFLTKFIEKLDDNSDLAYLLQLVKDVEKEFAIDYDEKQKEAIISALNSKMMILTGGPGTGKTTVVKAIIKLMQRLYPSWNCILCAPTGRAAKRLSELTSNPTSTIHSLLKWNLETNTFGMNINNSLEYDCIIADEFSMVDNFLMFNLLAASANIKKLIIIGDKNQLPAVGPGAVLRDLINVDLFPVVELNHIYRQKEGSGVISLAHDILKNKEKIKFEEDTKFIDCEDFEVRNIIPELVDQALNDGFSINDIQVLSCKYEGVAGIDNLNMVLQSKFNGPNQLKNEIQFGSRLFREHDKVLQLKNLNDQNIYNGDIGTIVDIEVKSPKTLSNVTIDFDGNIITYIYEDLYMISLAYCTSVHKSQGNEFPIVFMPFTKSDRYMLDKKLIYTAITRCSKSLVLLGNRDYFQHGILTNERHKRLTTLSLHLQSNI